MYNCKTAVFFQNQTEVIFTNCTPLRDRNSFPHHITAMLSPFVFWSCVITYIQTFLPFICVIGQCLNAVNCCTYYWGLLNEILLSGSNMLDDWDDWIPDHLTPASDVTSRLCLRSANQQQLLVPCCRLDTYGHRAFAIAGLSDWNSLPDELKDPAHGSDSFKQFLKTILFSF